MAGIAQRLKEAMEAKGLKQVDVIRLAEPIGREYNVRIGKSHMSQYLSGKASRARTYWEFSQRHLRLMRAGLPEKKQRLRLLKIGVAHHIQLLRSIKRSGRMWRIVQGQ